MTFNLWRPSALSIQNATNGTIVNQHQADRVQESHCAAHTSRGTGSQWTDRTGTVLLSPFQNRVIVATVMTCGLYDEVGHFAIRIGQPAKSGVSGGILAVLPGRMSIACYGPALGPNGNSMAGMAMLEFLSERLGLSLFEPDRVVDRSRP